MSRPSGSKNKVGAEVKAQILATYERLGALKAFAEWAGENKTEFYRIYAKLAPTEIIADITHYAAEELTDDVLAHIATGSSEGAIEAEGGTEESTPIH